MNISRRSMFRMAGAAGIAGLAPAAVSSMDPVARSGPPRMKLSLAAYSFRQYLGGKNKSMTYEEFVDICATYPLDAIEPTAYYFAEDVTAEYLRSFRRRAFLRGLTISGTAVGNSFTHPPGAKREAEIAAVKRWVDRAVDLGAPVIRIFAGNQQQGTSEEQARRWAVEAIEQCCSYSGERGVILALENHGGIVSTVDQLLSIVREVRSDWFGVNLDTGNFHGPDPYADLERAAPYAVTVQVKVDISPAGGARREADFGRLIEILRKTGYRGFVALEYEAKEDPRTAVPRYLQILRKLIS